MIGDLIFALLVGGLFLLVFLFACRVFNIPKPMRPRWLCWPSWLKRRSRNKWHHIVIVSDDPGYLEVYINGELVIPSDSFNPETTRRGYISRGWWKS